MQLMAPCSVKLLLHCHPDAPPDPSWLQAVSSQMPTAGHFSALEAPQLALDKLGAEIERRSFLLQSQH